jgi:hypothetical protein
LEKAADMGRANASVPPPAGKGTTRFTGLLGQAVWAFAPKTLSAAADAASFSASRRSKGEVEVEVEVVMKVSFC